MKEIIYLTSAGAGKKDIDVQTYEKLQHAIGDWHDKVVITDYLKKSQMKNKKQLISKLKIETEKELKSVDRIIRKI